MRVDSIWIRTQVQPWLLFGVMTVWLGLGLLAMGCTDREQGVVGESQNTTRIADADAFDQLLASAGDRLLVIDFFADWCAPCKVLAPILEKVASETKDLADVYTVDVDANRKLAQRMGVSGIPNLLLIKNGKVLNRLRGVLPKETYLAAIRSASR